MVISLFDSFRMSTIKVCKGKDGRQVQVLTEDIVGDDFVKIKNMDLLSCEKWMVLSLPDLLSKTGFQVSKIEDLKLKAAKILYPAPQSVPTLLTQLEYISFGCEPLDRLLGKSLQKETVLEIWGSAGSGKSQLALQLCANLSGPCYSAYISTEGPISTSRLFEMSGGRRVFCEVQQCSSVDSLTDCVMRQLPLLIATKPVGLVVIDSIAAPFRAGEVEGGGIRRAHKIRSIGQQLKYIAVEYKLLVVVINQATEHPIEGLKPALGLTWAYLVNNRIRIEKIDDIPRRRISVEKCLALEEMSYVDCLIRKDGFVSFSQ